jgi:hypothetical protein
VFVRSSGAWTQQAYLKASNTDAGDGFGSSVAISGDTVVVGAYAERSKATGVNGDQSDNSARSAGAAYVFVRSAGVWTQQAYLKASNTDALDYFGRSVSISGDTVVVGAYGEKSNATGVNGDQSNNSASRAGAAYVFDKDVILARSKPVGTGCIAMGAAPTLDVGPPVHGQDSRMEVRSFLPRTVGVILLGFPHRGVLLSSTCIAYFDVTLPFVPMFFSTDRGGEWSSLPIPISTSSALTGHWFALQAAINDRRTAPLGMALSNGVWVKIGY